MIFTSEDSLWEVVLKIEGRISFPLRGRLKIICPSSTFFPGFSPTLPRNERTLGTRSASLFPFPVLKNCDFFRFLHRHAHFQWQPPVNCLNAVSCFSASLSDYQINSSVSLFTAVTRKSGPTKSKFWTLRSYFIISPLYIITISW